MLKAISLLETLLALVIISVSVLIGVLIYTESLKDLVSPREIEVHSMMSKVWKEIQKNKDIEEKEIKFKYFKVLKFTEKNSDETGYMIELQGILPRDTISKTYFLNYED